MCRPRRQPVYSTRSRQLQFIISESLPAMPAPPEARACERSEPAAIIPPLLWLQHLPSERALHWGRRSSGGSRRSALPVPAGGSARTRSPCCGWRSRRGCCWRSFRCTNCPRMQPCRCRRIRNGSGCLSPAWRAWVGRPAGLRGAGDAGPAPHDASEHVGPGGVGAAGVGVAGRDVQADHAAWHGGGAGGDILCRAGPLLAGAGHARTGEGFGLGTSLRGGRCGTDGRGGGNGPAGLPDRPDRPVAGNDTPRGRRRRVPVAYRGRRGGRSCRSGGTWATRSTRNRILLGTLFGPTLGMICYVSALKYTEAGLVSTLPRPRRWCCCRSSTCGTRRGSAGTWWWPALAVAGVAII